MNCLKLMRHASAATIIVFLAFSIPALSQTTINVPADQPTIQGGIDFAQNGDTVLVAPGTYYEHINFHGKTITVKSSSGPSATIIDGTANGSVVTFNTGESAAAVLSGFTIRNGYATSGAGISITGASPTIVGNTISNNRAVYGMGIDISNGSPVIKNNTIDANSQAGGTGYPGGGGIYVRGSNGNIAAPLITENKISENSVSGGGIGGGISADYYASPTIRNNIIWGNSAYNHGGGIALDSYVAATIVQNLVVGNSSGAGGYGAGIYVNVRSAQATQIANNTVADNDAYDKTSGIYVTGVPDTTTVTNNIVVAASGQNGIKCAASYSTVSAEFSYNDVYSATGHAWLGVCDTTTYAGNISAEPRFVSNPAAVDYHLGADSPAIDAGDNAVPNLPATDLDGNTRVVDGNRDGNAVVDIGAFEYVPIVDFSPSALDFGDQALGITSPAQTVSVTALVALPGVYVTTTGDFAQTNDCPTPMPSGTTCTVAVTFTPSFPGHRSGALVVTSNEYRAGSQMALSGNGLGPVMTANPASVSFGAIVVGSVATQQVSLINSGTTPLTIGSISIGAPFTYGSNCAAPLNPDESCSVLLTFAPTQRGSFTDYLVVMSDAVNSPTTISVSGIGGYSAMALSPTSLTWSSVLDGSSSTQLVMLRNSGDAPLTLSSIAVSGPPFSVQHSCPELLAVNASCSASVTFAPVASGTYAGTLIFVDDAAGSPQAVSLSGTAIAPVLSVLPSSLTFTNVLASTTASQVVTLTSAGDAAVTINSISTPAAPFSRSTNCPTSLPVGASCQITVAFSPIARGTYTNAISINDNGIGGPQSIGLSGNAITVQLSVAPSPLAFGSVNIGSSAIKAITVANTGDLPVDIGGVGIKGLGFAQNNNCPASLGTGTSCQIDVTFSPTEITNYTGAVAISDNAVPNGHTVLLTGAGLAVGAPNPIDVPADQPTIQAGIDAAQNGDTVLVAPGTYYEIINFHGKAITVKSSSGPAATIIDGSANGSVVTFNSGETRDSVLNGFTITNGYAWDGAGINVSQTSPRIIGNVIKNNAGCGGIGIDVYFGSPLIQENTVSNNVQRGCSGGTGAGISIGGDSSAEVIGNTIESNTNGSADGGGIALSAAGTPSIRNNVIRGNSSYGSGAGISIVNDTRGSIAGNLIIGNQSSNYGGGGISLTVPYGDPGPIFTNNTIADNSSSLGSAVYFYGSTATVQFINNILVGSGDQPTIFCETYNNGTSPALSNSDVFNPNGPLYGGACVDKTGSNGNISADPQFVNAAAGDYHPQARSPAVDAGDSSAPNLPTTDLDGNRRIVDGNGDGTAVVDLGAYEFPGLPVLTVNPNSVDFGKVRVGTTSTQMLILTSSGEQPVTISSIAELAAPYSQTNDCPDSLAVGATCTVMITFMPSSRGAAGASLAISSNAAKGPSAVPITGTGVAPVVGLSSTSVTFGAQRYETSSAPQTVTLSNTGDAVLNIDGIALGGSGFAQSNNCTATLPAGASCQISLTFTPPARGTFSATLTITDDADASPQQVVLSGTGVAPIATFSPTTIAFAQQVLGTTSAAQSVTVSNSGDAPLNISGFSMSGDFAQGNNCGTSLTAGASCTINLTFTPTSTGVRSGRLNITSDGYGAAPVVSLSGTGVMAAPMLSPTSVAFGNMNVGKQSGWKNVKLTANSPGPLSISSIAVIGDFVQTNNCPAALNAGSSCTISVAFLPTTAGAENGALTILDNGLGSPQSVALSGNGLDYTLSATPSSIAVDAGGKATYTVTVSPLGGAYNTNVSLACSGLPAGSKCSFSPSGLTPGTAPKSSVVTVQTTAQSATSETPSGSYDIVITGTSGALQHSTEVSLIVN